jgi:hypothetical protein
VTVAAKPEPTSSSPAVPSACPKQRFAAVADGQLQSAVGTAELQRPAGLTANLTANRSH